MEASFTWDILRGLHCREDQRIGLNSKSWRKVVGRITPIYYSQRPKGYFGGQSTESVTSSMSVKEIYSREGPGWQTTAGLQTNTSTQQIVLFLGFSPSIAEVVHVAKLLCVLYSTHQANALFMAISRGGEHWSFLGGVALKTNHKLWFSGSRKVSMFLTSFCKWHAWWSALRMGKPSNQPKWNHLLGYVIVCRFTSITYNSYRVENNLKHF